MTLVVDEITKARNDESTSDVQAQFGSRTGLELGSLQPVQHRAFVFSSFRPFVID
jgi:hypothetical protein